MKHAIIKLVQYAGTSTSQWFNSEVVVSDDRAEALEQLAAYCDGGLEAKLVEIQADGANVLVQKIEGRAEMAQ